MRGDTEGALGVIRESGRAIPPGGGLFYTRSMASVAMSEGIPSPTSLTRIGFAREALVHGLSADAARRVYQRYFREGPAAAGFVAPVVRSVMTDESPHGEVRKFTVGVAGTERIRGTLETESVVIPMRHKRGLTHTLCVSSQVGCAMGCGFCETAQMGLIRSLTVGEIVDQWVAARHGLGAEISNIVFMGMGEPLDNLDSVLGAIEVMTDHDGPAAAMSRITVSTVGRLDGLARVRERVMADGWRRLNLAVSINAPNDAIRSEIMPINRSMPLGELVEVMRGWPMRAGGALCAEYVLIPGVNDADAHADELAALLKGIRCCVNVIPYNPIRNSRWEAPREEDVWRFLRRLEGNGQFCKRRVTKGRTSMAACGQLGNEGIRGRRLVGVTTSGG